jgi:putative redox protein
VRAIARRRDGFTHDVETDNGHTIVADEPLDEGGANLGAQPTRLLAASLASCTAITIEMYAERKDWELGAVEVEVNGVRGDPGEATRFEVAIRIPGEIDESQEKQILTVAAKCPVHRILKAEVVFEERVERV